MSKQLIANFLKQLRKTSGLSVDAVIEELQKYDTNISTKTLYGYENGTSMLNADVFVALCRIYKCDNPMDLFGNSSMNPVEIDILEKYRFIAEHFTSGTNLVDSVLNQTYDIAEQLKNQKEHIEELESTVLLDAAANAGVRIINYYYRLASAGTGQILFDMPPTKRIEIPDIPKYKKADYAIGVNGNSMEPAYKNGDTLLVEMTEQIEVGEIGIFSVDNECYVKQLGQNELLSLNAECANIPLNETAHCMGRVIGKL
ncbi:MAG: XRE family transcriptional regulator [Ruminococcus sp.]|nr:XRE family transcriptional regulator [Ruminococcus sp.]